MGGVSPETCWASYKYEIKFWYTVASCWIFYVNCTMMHGSTNIKWLINRKECGRKRSCCNWWQYPVFVWISRGCARNTVRIGRGQRFQPSREQYCWDFGCDMGPFCACSVHMYWTRVREQLTKDGGVLGAYVLNKQSGAAKNGWSSRQRNEVSPTNLHGKIYYCVLRRYMSWNLTRHFP